MLYAALRSSLAVLAISASLLLLGGCDFPQFGNGSKDRPHITATGPAVDALLEEFDAKLVITPGDPGVLIDKFWILLAQEQYEFGDRAARTFAELIKQGGGKGVLGQALRDPNWVVRRNAVYCIKRLGLEKAARVLKKMIHDPEPAVRRMAVRTLGELVGDDAKFELLLSLKDSSWEVRAEAASALGKLGTPSSAKYLFRSLKDTDLFVRFEVASALVAIICDDNESVYRKQLKRASLKVARRVAAVALATRGERESVPVLKEIVNDRGAVVRLEAACLLLRLAPSEAEIEFARLLPTEPDEELAKAIAACRGQGE